MVKKFFLFLGLGLGITFYHTHAVSLFTPFSNEEWHIDSYNNIFMSSYNLLKLKENQNYIARFFSSGDFFITTDCNNIISHFEIKKNRIQFKDIIATKKHVLIGRWKEALNIFYLKSKNISG